MKFLFLPALMEFLFFVNVFVLLLRSSSVVRRGKVQASDSSASGNMSFSSADSCSRTA